MRVLHYRKVIFIFLVLAAGLSAGQTFGQRMHHFDVRDFNLGFTMGLNLAGYDMTAQIKQVDPATGRRLESIKLVRRPGIYLGLITNFKISDNFDVRFLPSVSLEERGFEFYFDPATNNGESLVLKKIEASNLNLPLVIKFKSNYYNRTRIFVQFGIQPSINLASNKKVRNDLDLLKTQSFDLAYVASFGIDLYGERLKLSPEIRFTRGLRQLYVDDRTRFPKAISDLFSQLLVFNINFE
ncbi:MAG TPA: PorT family protein [Bacteroidetes bacterium]|nr:PorT family protein [Bacteroidota bacterium]